MEQRVSVITLGVDDLPRACVFYEKLGWRAANDVEAQEVAFYQSPGMVIALWDREELAEDSGVEDSGGSSGFALAHNVHSPEQVDAVIAEVKAAGGKVTREPAETDWGGYSAYFTDPDGNRWEVAHNPHWVIADDGSVSIPSG